MAAVAHVYVWAPCEAAVGGVVLVGEAVVVGEVGEVVDAVGEVDEEGYSVFGC